MTLAPRIKALSAVFATFAVLITGLAALPQAAQAYDAYPCHSPRERTFNHQGHNWKVEVRTCPLWRGNVPVYKYRSPSAPIVGYLKYGGNANWFVLERKAVAYNLGGAWNDWWASTMADNYQWGWVPEVFFSGGDNWEQDRGLLEPGPITCAVRCPPLPPWWI